MKSAIIISEGIKQLMFTPENEEEKLILKMITINDEITIESKIGTFYDNIPNTLGYSVEKCKGGFLRAYENEESLMIVLTPKKVEKDA